MQRSKIKHVNEKEEKSSSAPQFESPERGCMRVWAATVFRPPTSIQTTTATAAMRSKKMERERGGWVGERPSEQSAYLASSKGRSTIHQREGRGGRQSGQQKKKNNDLCVICRCIAIPFYCFCGGGGFSCLCVWACERVGVRVCSAVSLSSLLCTSPLCGRKRKMRAHRRRRKRGNTAVSVLWRGGE